MKEDHYLCELIFAKMILFLKLACKNNCIGDRLNLWNIQNQKPQKVPDSEEQAFW